MILFVDENSGASTLFSVLPLMFSSARPCTLGGKGGASTPVPLVPLMSSYRYPIDGNRRRRESLSVFLKTPMTSSLNTIRDAIRDRRPTRARGNAVAELLGRGQGDENKQRSGGEYKGVSYVYGGGFICQKCGMKVDSEAGIKCHITRMHERVCDKNLARTYINDALEARQLTQSEDQEQHHKAPDWVTDFTHKARVLPNDEVKACIRKPSLRTPHLNDADSWRKAEIEVIKTIDDSFRAAQSVQERMDVLEKGIYDTFSDMFGIREVSDDKAKPKPKAGCKSKRPRQLERLRRLKSERRREWRRVKRCGGNVQATHRKLMEAVRAYAELNKLVMRNRVEVEQKQQRERFRKDRDRFARELFHPPTAGKPEFGKKEADEYFTKQFADDERETEYVPLEGMPRPPPPKFFFDTGEMQVQTVSLVLRKKRNASAPGINGIPYTVYKRCPRLLGFLILIFQEVWSGRLVPKNWRLGRVTLIPKDGDNSKPGLMRDITVLNVEGRVFWAVFQRRLASFLTKNDYLRTSVQKAFLEKIAGCVEHSVALGEVLRDARERTRQVVIAWLDLRNAYGSVRHSMIQFALKWYYVPRKVVELFVNYVEGIFCQIQATGWKSEWFGLEMGVPKGCTAATIVFDLAFQLVLDMHEFLTFGKARGYVIEPNICIKSPTYADDVALVEVSPQRAQASVNGFAKALEWTKSMALKPVKCRTVAFKKFGRPGDTKWGYRPFDPRLKLGKEVLPFIARDDPPMFKYLGRCFQANGTEDIALERLLKSVEERLELVDATRLTGPMKAFIANNYVIPMSLWQLMIHDFPTSVAEQVNAIFQRRFRAWFQLARPADASVLYRARMNRGLGLKNVVDLHQSLQVVKWHIMKDSLDEQSRNVYSHRVKRDKAGHVGQGRKSSPCLDMEGALYAAQMKEISGVDKANIGRAGLGLIRRVKASERDKVKDHLKQEAEHKRVVRCLTQFKDQNDWCSWNEHVSELMDKDLSWDKILNQYSDKLVRFYLNAMQGTLPTGSNLRRWNKADTYHCGLCFAGAQHVTARHILVGCKYVHNVENKECPNGGRYAWRHNQVLRVIGLACGKLVKEVNKDFAKSRVLGWSSLEPVPEDQRLIEFHKAGKFKRRRKPTAAMKKLGWLWGHADDWEASFHLSEWGLNEFGSYSFPADVCLTTQNPDGYLISRESRRLVVIELTCPWEDRMEHWHNEKTKTYQALCTGARSNGWQVYQLSLEVGARGHIRNTFYRDLKGLGMPKAQIQALSSDVVDVARKSSFVIFINRFNKRFQPWGANNRVPRGFQEDALSV